MPAGTTGDPELPLTGEQGGGRRFADLLPRALSALVLVALALGTAIWGGRPFAMFWWAASLAILWEWQRLIGGPRLTARFIAGGIALSLSGPMIGSLQVGWAICLIAVGAIPVGLVAATGWRFFAAAGVVYAGALMTAVDLLRQSFPFGFEAIIWLFAVVWATDIMAYVGGRLVGGPKLWPRASPSKTWAGFFIGIACGSLAGLAVAPAPGPYGMYVALGLVAGAVAQGGDLFESALKRRFGAKDSSRLIPGHGGVMDRLDGFLAAAVLAAVLGVARFGVESPGAGLFSW